MSSNASNLSRLVLLGATLAAAGCGLARPDAAGLRAAGGLQAHATTRRVLVKFKDARLQQAAVQKMQLAVVGRIAKLDTLVVRAADPQAMVRALRAEPGVAYAEPDHVARAFEAPMVPALPLNGKDELLPRLWGMAKIEAPKAWGVTTGSRQVKVAIVDTGVDYNHPDLRGRTTKGFDYINGDGDAMDDNEHGTHCAGSAAAGINDGGVVGVAPNVTIVPVKVLDAEGSGSYSSVANGIIYAADENVNVISLSLGGPTTSPTLESAVRYAKDKGILVVAAMGNDGDDVPQYPAAIPGVLGVGATTSKDEIAYFSSRGNHISVSAPGDLIMSCIPGGKYERFSGTSMACPHVAGLAALVKSKHPTLGAADLRARIEKGAQDLGAKGFDPVFGHGRINAARAIL
jgi:thermitase